MLLTCVGRNEGSRRRGRSRNRATTIKGPSLQSRFSTYLDSVVVVAATVVVGTGEICLFPETVTQFCVDAE